MTPSREIDAECPCYELLEEPPTYEDVMEERTSPWVRPIRSLDFSRPKNRRETVATLCAVVLMIALGGLVFLLLGLLFYDRIK
ncbi:hypothetical protein QR680_016734 [Steinernema hermaphroditum]|uniref:Uncharacterized protein n=1 Tax=Steinernema hermaphroditum TaxID=289476 RepID=A0AA39HC61_9BILA|nr:hypothetical protein QR680_016734 [Steinernema hermaphroditum]